MFFKADTCPKRARKAEAYPCWCHDTYFNGAHHNDPLNKSTHQNNKNCDTLHKLRIECRYSEYSYAESRLFIIILSVVVSTLYVTLFLYRSASYTGNCHIRLKVLAIETYKTILQISTSKLCNILPTVVLNIWF